MGGAAGTTSSTGLRFLNQTIGLHYCYTRLGISVAVYLPKLSCFRQKFSAQFSQFLVNRT